MNMSSIKKIIILTLFMLACIILSACEEDSIIENESELVVVSAFLYEGQPVEDIQLTKTLSLGSEDTVDNPINEALVTR